LDEEQSAGTNVPEPSTPRGTRRYPNGVGPICAPRPIARPLAVFQPDLSWSSWSSAISNMMLSIALPKISRGVDALLRGREDRAGIEDPPHHRPAGRCRARDVAAPWSSCHASISTPIGEANASICSRWISGEM
jgi:hypothetical protein